MRRDWRRAIAENVCLHVGRRNGVAGLGELPGQLYRSPVGPGAVELSQLAASITPDTRIAVLLGTEGAGLSKRWSDAAVGVLLIVLLRAMGVGTTVVTVMTVVFVALWIVAADFLNVRQDRAQVVC